MTNELWLSRIAVPVNALFMLKGAPSSGSKDLFGASPVFENMELE